MNIRKAVFLLLENLPWNVFRQTGNIETYLLMKEMKEQSQQSPEHQASSIEQESQEDLNL
ncbi:MULTISPECIES: YqzL family protein [Halobacillus]|uniref:YqzL family protein n=1 Tax=Halobacillus TaxID=45667 RepID=UPI001CB893F0|nr:YqzL family protein [Halobacillus halophilus]